MAAPNFHESYICFSGPHIANRGHCINDYFEKQQISREIFSDPANFHMLSQYCLADFFQSYPNYKIETRDQLLNAIKIQWCRNYIQNDTYMNEKIQIDEINDSLMRKIIPMLLKQVFLSHPEAFLNETILKQGEIIENAVKIISTLQLSSDLNFQLFSKDNDKFYEFLIFFLSKIGRLNFSAEAQDSVNQTSEVHVGSELAAKELEKMILNYIEINIDLYVSPNGLELI
jgi:hypothetical protein